MIGIGARGAAQQSAGGGGGGGPAWSTVDEWASTINFSSFANYTHRLRIDRSLIADAATTKIRITYAAHTPGAGASATAVYIGLAADSGDGFDFDGAPVEVTFASASGFSLAAGASILSDEITLALDGTRDILIAGQTASGQPGEFAQSDGRSGWLCWYKAGADAVTQDASGYSANPLESIGVVKIEVQ